MKLIAIISNELNSIRISNLESEISYMLAHTLRKIEVPKLNKIFDKIKALENDKIL